MLRRNMNRRFFVLFVKTDIMLHLVQIEESSSLTSAANLQGSFSVLLQKIKVQVKNKTSSQLSHARTLFYSCSQVPHVTLDLKREFNLASMKQRNISIQTFGKIDSRDTLEQVELCVISNDDKEIPINCFAKIFVLP